MSQQHPPAALFAGRSEMHERVSALNWAATPVGPVESWPQSLRATIKTLLGSRYPMILLWGPELIQIYNEAYIGLIGDKHPGALGRSIRETQAESWEVIGPMIHEVMSTGIPNWVPAQMLPLERSGYREESYFSLSYSAVDDDEGRITGMLCVCSEVTQQILGERRTRLLRDLALEASEARSVARTCRDITAAVARHPLDVPFALLYLRASDGKRLTLCGSVGIAPGTRAAPSDVSLAEEQSMAWPLGRALSGETVWVDDVDRRIALTGGPWNDVVRSAQLMPVASAEPGRSLGVLVVGVSPNRALDEGYSSFHHLLVSQVSVAIRNARAYEDERRRAEALAELDRVKTEFFSNVSHEFRTPLTLMLGPVEDLLASQRLSDADRQELEVVHRNAGRLLRLVNTLLDFSRLEAGRIEASFEPTDLASLTADLASSFRSAIERAGLTLRVDCPRLSEPAYVDHEMWEKVVLNLLSNALKFTFEGGITVRLCENDGRVTLEVADTGTGIPAAELPHLFERFHRVRGARSRSHEGTGIGLALVHELVKLHNGEVTVSSTEGKGSTFAATLPLGAGHLPSERVRAPRTMVSTATTAATFVEEALRWLPGAAAAAQSAAPAQQASAGAEQAALPEARHGRILVADDNADMREYLARVLAPWFDVVTAEDGQAALEQVHGSGPFDVVLTDVMMPRLDGLGLLEALREQPGTRALPVILLSARAGEEASVEGLEAGADDYLVKPFSARELVARTRITVELTRMRQEIAAHAARETALQESLRLRDEFLAIASHELKTPLTPLRLHLDAVMRSARGEGKELSPERLMSKMEGIERQVGRLATLVDGLLNVARILNHRLQFEREDVDLAQVVRDVATRFAEDLEQTGCTLALDLPQQVVGCWDRLRLEEIAANLVSNAIKFGAARPIEIHLDTRDGRARLQVRDHGIGIAPADHARIFERFGRAVPTRHYGGFGLGLWLVRQLVEALGGDIAVDSQLGSGALFTVELPLGRAG
jgi:signal transduction histidine kinase